MISAEGKVINPTKVEKASKTLKQIARIKKYAAKCVSKLPLPPPGGGDCLYCQGEAGLQPQCNFSEGALEHGQLVTKPMNFATNPGDHIGSHLKDMYVVPALVYNAMKQLPSPPAGWWGAFKSESYSDGHLAFSKQIVRKAVIKYVKRQLGL